MKTKFCYGKDEENCQGDITCETHEEAVLEAIREVGAEVGGSVWVGETRVYVPHLSGSCILEDLGNAASDEIGEAADDWPNVSKEEEEELEVELNKVLDVWLDKHKNRPHFYYIDDYQPIEVTEELYNKAWKKSEAV